jgi:uncharacterized SAM-binding protein YcdF (DUF218 family)
MSNLPREEVCLVFLFLKDHRHHADTDQFSARPWGAGRGSFAHPMVRFWPQAARRLGPASGTVRIFADRKTLDSAPGAIDPDLSAVLDRPALGHSGDRIVAAAELARRYPTARIVYSGGNANLIGDDSLKEADYALSMLEDLGVAKARLTAERLSRNTFENAEFVKTIVKPKQGERWLLVTSAVHMPRSIGLFRRAGFNVEAYPVDRRAGESEGFWFYPMAISGLERTDLAMREWIGLTAYRLTGKIDRFFPGPDEK